ncbi:NUDIX hydrolase [Haloferula sargassicola]|uniref:GDP-mannose pyrophosphatase n=1 Tax=Haloferula sargassicola TaxID=490096 RepID=A0ABP9UPJ5_9BACT
MIETLFETRWLGVYRDGHWDFVRRPNADAAVGILAVTPDDKLLLVEQFRIPMQKRVIEIPAGLVGDEEEFQGEDLAETARRELLEETGYRAGSIELLLSSPTSAGMTSETTHIYLARDLEKAGPGGGTGAEDILVHEVPLGEVRGFLREKEASGCLVDFKIQAALWQAGLA